VLSTTPKGQRPMYEMHKIHILPLYLFGQSVTTTFAFSLWRRLQQFTYVHHTIQASTFQMLLLKGNFVPAASHPGITPHACAGRLNWWNRRLTRVVECCHNTLVNSYLKRLRVAQFINTNGPPVELVGVAERLEAVTTKALLLWAGSRYTAERSEAWRGFCRPGTSFMSITSVAVQCL
jgi:hypothetical protein